MNDTFVKANVISKITIDASAKLVFEYLTDLKLHFLWNPHLQQVTPIEKLKLGTVYKSTSTLLGVRVQGDNKVIKYTLNRELALENSTGTIKYAVNYLLKSKLNSTLLTCTTSVYSNYRTFIFTTAVFKLLARRELQSDLEALKIAVENNLT